MKMIIIWLLLQRKVIITAGQNSLRALLLLEKGYRSSQTTTAEWGDWVEWGWLFPLLLLLIKQSVQIVPQRFRLLYRVQA